MEHFCLFKLGSRKDISNRTDIDVSIHDEEIVAGRDSP